MGVEEQQQQQQSAPRARCMDFVEFCLTERDQQESSSSSSSKYNNNNDYENVGSDQQRYNTRSTASKQQQHKHALAIRKLFNAQKTLCDTTYATFQELVLLHQIGDIHRFSSFVSLAKMYASPLATSNIGLYAKQRHIIDLTTLRTLVKSRELNWVDTFSPLYPIKTIGDGNCLVIFAPKIRSPNLKLEVIVNLFLFVCVCVCV